MSWLSNVLSGSFTQRHRVRRVKFRNSNFGIRIFPTPRPQRPSTSCSGQALRGELSETFRIGELENGKEQINENVYDAHSTYCSADSYVHRDIPVRVPIETGVRRECGGNHRYASDTPLGRRRGA